MGTLQGDLSVLGLSDLFQLLADRDKAGTLVVDDGTSRKTVYFGETGLRLLSIGKRRGPLLGELLVRTRRLTREQLERVLAVQKERGIRLGQAVVALGLIPQNEVDQFILSQVEEEIYDLFTWEGAKFVFAEGDPAPELVDEDSPIAILDVDVTSLILEAARRVDEWQMISEIIPDDSVVPTLKTPVETLRERFADDPRALSVIPHVDGIKDIADLMFETGLPSFHVCRTLFVLHREGLLSRGNTTVRKDGARKPEPSVLSKKVRTIMKERKYNGTVIVMSDLSIFRKTLIGDLRRFGFNTLEVLSVHELVRLLRTVAPDVVLFDMPFPNQETLKSAKELVDRFGVRLIAMSPDRSKNTIVETIRNGARDYMVKPFKSELLASRIQKVIAKGD